MMAIYNKLCELEDWNDSEYSEAMRSILPYFLEMFPDYPNGYEHRKHWEYAQIFLGLRGLGALEPDAFILSVGSGNEEPVFYLTNFVRWVFATDIYGTGQFITKEADENMLTNPDFHGRCPYNRNRLVVQYMNALDLRFEENTFEAVYSSSSIEHFGGIEGAVKSLREIQRVLKIGGIAAITTECIVNGAPTLSQPGLELFTPQDIEKLRDAIQNLELIEPIRFDISERTLARPIKLAKAIADAQRGHTDYPHVILEMDGRLWTSISLFFRKVG